MSVDTGHEVMAILMTTGGFPTLSEIADTEAIVAMLTDGSQCATLSQVILCQHRSAYTAHADMLMASELCLTVGPSDGPHAGFTSGAVFVQSVPYFRLALEVCRRIVSLARTNNDGKNAPVTLRTQAGSRVLLQMLWVAVKSCGFRDMQLASQPDAYARFQFAMFKVGKCTEDMYNVALRDNLITFPHACTDTGYSEISDEDVVEFIRGLGTGPFASDTGEFVSGGWNVFSPGNLNVAAKKINSGTVGGYDMLRRWVGGLVDQIRSLAAVGLFPSMRVCRGYPTSWAYAAALRISDANATEEDVVAAVAATVGTDGDLVAVFDGGGASGSPAIAIAVEACTVRVLRVISGIFGVLRNRDLVKTRPARKYLEAKDAHGRDLQSVLARFPVLAGDLERLKATI